MATAPLLLLLAAAAAPHPGDCAVVRAVEAAVVVRDIAPSVKVAQVVAAAPQHVAVVPARVVRRPASAPILERFVPLRVADVVVAPSLTPRFEPAQPQAPPAR
jgi:hypothetical protein